MSTKKITICAIGGTLLALPFFIFAANISGNQGSNPGQHGPMIAGRNLTPREPGYLATSTIPVFPRDKGNATSTVPIPNMVEISGKGEAMIIGTVASTGSGTLTVTSWGGNWTINIVTATKFAPAGNAIANIATGDTVEIQGTANKTANWTVDANVVRDSTNQAKNIAATTLAHPALNQGQIQKLQEQYKQLMAKLQQLIQTKNQLGQGKH